MEERRQNAPFNTNPEPRLKICLFQFEISVLVGRHQIPAILIGPLAHREWNLLLSNFSAYILIYIGKRIPTALRREALYIGLHDSQLWKTSSMLLLLLNLL